MIGSIFVKMPEITKEFDEEIGVEIINNYFIRLKGDIYIPLFNLPLLHTEIFSKKHEFDMASKLTNITYKYYEKYLELRKHKRFKIKVFLPEKYGGNALYYLLQKFMICEATPKEIKIISEFLPGYIFDGKRVRMENLLYRYYRSISGLFEPEPFRYKKSVSINTPVGVTPLYTLDNLLDPLNPDARILSTDFRYNLAFINVLTSRFFGKSAQLGSLKFRFLKSFGELDLNWDNVKVVSFKELYDISDAIIKNNLPATRYNVNKYYHPANVFFSYSPILSAVGNAIDFKNKSVMLLFAMVRRIKYFETMLRLCNDTASLNTRDTKFFLISVPFKNIKKFIFRDYYNSGIFIIEQDGKTIPVLSNHVGPHWVGVGRRNIIMGVDDDELWYNLIRKLASPEHLKKVEKELRID